MRSEVLNSINNLFYDEKYDEALEKYTKSKIQWNNLIDSNLKICYSIALCYFRLGQFEKCLPLVNNIIRKLKNKKFSEEKYGKEYALDFFFIIKSEIFRKTNKHFKAYLVLLEYKSIGQNFKEWNVAFDSIKMVIYIRYIHPLIVILGTSVFILSVFLKYIFKDMLFAKYFFLIILTFFLCSLLLMFFINKKKKIMQLLFFNFILSSFYKLKFFIKYRIIS